MPGKKIQELGKPRRKTEAEWQWRKNYRVWDANRRIFLYRENCTEPELHLPARFRVSLSDVAIFIRPRCRVKGFRILLAGKNRTRRLLAAQNLARDLEKDLYRIDLNGVVSDYMARQKRISAVSLIWRKRIGWFCFSTKRMLFLANALM
jgi:hypothetical protein